jgi:hypothetical protein
LKQVIAGIVHSSHHLLLLLKRTMKFGDRIAIVRSETKVYQVQLLTAGSVRVTEKKVFWFNITVDDM